MIRKISGKYGEWALVAGSAVGLGRAFCRLLAADGIHLVLVDHQEAPLQKLAGELKDDFGIEVKRLLLDLKEEDAVQQIMDATSELDCRLIICNAAFSRIQPFMNYSPGELDALIHVNVRSTLQLVHGFSRRWISRPTNGGILLMSSLSGLIGMNLIAPYAASKAFSWNMAESLYHELKTHNIDITACVAGATATEAYLGSKPHYGMVKPPVESPEKVARAALKKLGKTAWFIAGWRNRLSYFFLLRLLPRNFAAWIVSKSMRSMYPDK